MRTRRDLLLPSILLVLATVPFTSCSKSEEASTDVSFSTSTAPTPPTAQASATTPATATPSGAMIARSMTNDVVSISLSGTPRVEVVSADSTSTLTAESKDTGKRKYYDASGNQLVEVKASDSGFKVRTPDGKLLWKVKVSDDKIKVSDNEENLNAWAIKTGYPDKAKVLDPSESEVGEVRFANDPAPARVRDRSGADAWTIAAADGSGAWGVLLMSSIPLEHRAIILTELLSRGR